jgi:hypothetical protein
LPDAALAALIDIRTGFRSAFVFEIQDTVPSRPESIAIHVLALNPRSYVLSEPFQSTLTPTEDDTVVAEENGLIVRELTIEGTAGLSEKRGPAFDGDQGSLRGNEHFLHLRNLFRAYSRLKKGPQSANYRMVFHSLKEDDHFVVVPRSFETPRDARTTRMHYDYRISLAVVAEADNQLLPLELDEGFDFFSDELAAVAGAFNDVRAAFAEVTADLSAIKRKVANINSVMIQAAGMINAVGNMLRAGSELIEYPYTLAKSVLALVDNTADNLATSAEFAEGTLGRAERSLRRMASGLDRIAANPSRFGPDSLQQVADQFLGESALTGDDLDRQEAGASVGSRTRIAVGSKLAGLALGAFRGIRQHRLIRTDNIDGLAARFLTTAELIVLINDLRFPYITEDGGPGMRKPGDLILIPIPEGVGGASVQPQADYLTPDEALYGIDLALDPVAMQSNRLELLPDRTRSLQDAQLSRGLNNVIQGTEILVRTERGSTTYIPELGIRRSAGGKGTIQHMLLTALNLREAILSDPRIEGIENSRVVLEDDVLTQEITPRLISQKEGVTLVLPFGRASGGG